MPEDVVRDVEGWLAVVRDTGAIQGRLEVTLLVKVSQGHKYQTSTNKLSEMGSFPLLNSATNSRLWCHVWNSQRFFNLFQECGFKK